MSEGGGVVSISESAGLAEGGGVISIFVVVGRSGEPGAGAHAWSRVLDGPKLVEDLTVEICCVSPNSEALKMLYPTRHPRYAHEAIAAQSASARRRFCSRQGGLGKNAEPRLRMEGCRELLQGWTENKKNPARASRSLAPRRVHFSLQRKHMFPKPQPLPGNRGEIMELIQQAADNSAPHQPPMHVMALQLCSSRGPSAVAVLHRLLDTCPAVIEARGIANNTLLHCAAQAGNAELSALLLSREPSLCTAVNAAGARPYDLAVCEAVRALLRMASPPDPSASDCAMPEAGLEEEEVEDEILGGFVVTLRSLPEEMHVHILMQIDEPRVLLRMRETCRRWRVVADRDPIWERLCWTAYRRAARTSCLAGSWREVYIEHTLLQLSIKARQEEERAERYLDRRSLAGLERQSREAVEAPADISMRVAGEAELA